MTWVRLAVLLLTVTLADLGGACGLGGLGGAPGQARADDIAAYRVTDPNASFFAREGALASAANRRFGAPARPVRAAEPPCPRDQIAEPIAGVVRVPAFYRDPAGWRRASRPLFAFEAQATGFAADYARSGDPAYARCLVELLGHWAARGALLAFDYEADHGQAWFAVQWSTASAGLAYSVVRAAPSLADADKRAVEAWLAAVATHQTGYPGTSVTCCNNHLYWRGLEAAIVGVVADDDRLFQYGIRAFLAALEAMRPDGSLPRETARGARALHYQNFAVLPLVFLAEVAARQGYDLYGLAVEGRDLHLAVRFLLRALDDPAALRRYTAEAQDLGFVERRAELNWLEPYHRRFPSAGTARWLARLRPLSHAWTGGPATLYFAESETAGDRARATPPKRPPAASRAPAQSAAAP